MAMSLQYRDQDFSFIFVPVHRVVLLLSSAISTCDDDCERIILFWTKSSRIRVEQARESVVKNGTIRIMLFNGNPNTHGKSEIR